MPERQQQELRDGGSLGGLKPVQSRAVDISRGCVFQETPVVECSRCHAKLDVDYSPDDAFTCGFYAVAVGVWSQFANPGEVFLCDACMWSGPLYISIYGRMN
jgi:hypothetical protein